MIEARDGAQPLAGRIIRPLPVVDEKNQGLARGEDIEQPGDRLDGVLRGKDAALHPYWPPGCPATARAAARTIDGPFGIDCQQRVFQRLGGEHGRHSVAQPTEGAQHLQERFQRLCAEIAFAVTAVDLTVVPGGFSRNSSASRVLPEPAAETIAKCRGFPARTSRDPA